MRSKSQATIGLALLGLGLALTPAASGCDDGCVRNSDCPMSYECTDAVCTAKNISDAGSDATDEDSGE